MHNNCTKCNNNTTEELVIIVCKSTVTTFHAKWTD